LIGHSRKIYGAVDHGEGGMGLIRKTLAVGTVGVVRPHSKKQRYQRELIKQSKISNDLAAAQIHAQLVAQAEAQRAIAYAQAQAAYLNAQAGAAAYQQARPEPLPPQPSVRPGWYPDPFGSQTDVRWHDGARWTDHMAPTRPQLP